jgi:hypothetical protein
MSRRQQTGGRAGWLIRISDDDGKHNQGCAGEQESPDVIFGLLDELENVFWATGTGIGAVERLCVEVKLVYEGLDGEVVAEEEETGGDSDNCEDSCEEPPVVAREEQAFFQEIEERWGGALPGCHGWMLELAS